MTGASCRELAVYRGRPRCSSLDVRCCPPHFGPPPAAALAIQPCRFFFKCGFMPPCPPDLKSDSCCSRNAMARFCVLSRAFAARACSCRLTSPMNAASLLTSLLSAAKLMPNCQCCALTDIRQLGLPWARCWQQCNCQDMHGACSKVRRSASTLLQALAPVAKQRTALLLGRHALVLLEL
jgi:hypothetical protein